MADRLKLLLGRNAIRRLGSELDGYYPGVELYEISPIGEAPKFVRLLGTCPDCPDLPNGTAKRGVCCRRGGELKIGDRVPMPPQKLDIRPAFTGAGKPSFTPARKNKR